MQSPTFSHPVELIAEIGGNHEGSIDKLYYLSELALSAGLRNLKYQLYTPESLVNPLYSLERFEHFKRFTLDPEVYIDLFKHLRSIQPDIKISVSAWSISLLSLFLPHIDYIKIGSGDLGFLRIHHLSASSRLPVVISTGLSSLSEVEYIYSLYHSNIHQIGTNLFFLHCVSSYPTPDEYINFARFSELIGKFGIGSIGYSHHHVETFPLYYFLSHGARIIEFHFTDNKDSSEFRDHQLSLTPSDLPNLFRAIELYACNNKVILGNIAELVNNNRNEFRRSLFASHDLSVGHTISVDDLTVLRPLVGIDAIYEDDVIGLTITKPVAQGHAITWEHVALS
ncbi:N-acetylneuraminate synthase family protein [Synechococcus sp. AH-707-M23]|nr:N-acetylneuraminate synthase family protein [Synechococcus sp. AH-707-M23]